MKDPAKALLEASQNDALIFHPKWKFICEIWQKRKGVRISDECYTFELAIYQRILKNSIAYHGFYKAAHLLSTLLVYMDIFCFSENDFMNPSVVFT